MSTFFKKILCRITLFFALAVTQNAQATPNFDILRGFEQITQIPDHANPYAGMALLHMMPTYLNALDEDQTPATKNLLLHLFKCPHPELDPSHILPVTGEFQVAHHLKPLLIGEIIATIDFAQKDIPESISVEDTQQKIITLKAILLHKLNTHLPNTSEFHKKNRHFVDLLIESLKECGSFSLDAQNAQLIPHFASGALLAFLCLMASDKESLQEYCIAYQVEKNRLVGTELEIQYPIEEIATTKKRNVLMSWKAAKTINSQSIFIDSLITFLKSTYNEMAQIIEIPDIKTRGTRYPVCIETLLCNLVQFTLKSSTFKNKELSIINFFKESQTQNLEQHITDFSQLINNLPGFVYGKIITSDDNVVSRHTKKFDLASEIDGFIHIGDDLSESKLTNFFKNREDFKIIKEHDDIVFIHLGNKILGVYNPTTTYGLAIRANLNNVITGLVHLLEINFEVNNELLLCNAPYAKEIFDSLAPILGWELETLVNSNNYETLRISASNNTGGLIINLSAVHGFCSCPTEKGRLHCKSNALNRDLFKLHYTTQDAQHACKSLILLTSLAPWNLSWLLNVPAAPTNHYASLPGAGPIAQRVSEIPEGLARHLYLGQEINDESCVVSIIDILQNDRGCRFIDVINFLHKNIKAAVSARTKELLNIALSESSWINQNPELCKKLRALVV